MPRDLTSIEEQTVAFSPEQVERIKGYQTSRGIRHFRDAARAYLSELEGNPARVCRGCEEKYIDVQNHPFCPKCTVLKVDD